MSSLAAVADNALHNAVQTVTPPFTAQPVSSPLQHFARFFQASLAHSTAQKQQTFRLRHQVYCEELQFEPGRDTGLEHDQFDQRAIHCAISRLSTQELAGTVRLITSGHASELLPVEHYCASALQHPSLTPQHFDRHQICEISRLAVPAVIRQRKLATAPSNISSINTLLHTLEGRCCEAVAISLYLVAMLMCLHYKKYHVFVMAEPALARVLRRIGIHFVQIGDVVDFNGKRAPFYVDARTTLNTLGEEYKVLTDILSEQLFATDIIRPSCIAGVN